MDRPAARRTSRATPPTRSTAWRTLSSSIARCTRCPLARTRTHVVVYRGGDRPRVVFVGEAPGRAEDEAGVPFVGASGKRLDRAITALGLGPGEVGIVNVLKCRPPENRFPRSSVATCRPYLDRQLELLDPKVVVTLGRHALATLSAGAPPITKVAGHALSWHGRTLVPLLHPAAVLHNPRLAARWDHDLRALGTILRTALGQTL